MKKRLCMLLLTLCLLICCFAVPAFAAEGGSCGEQVTWSLEGETLVISGTGPMADYSAENPAPWSDLGPIYDLKIGSGITEIGDYAFYGMELLLDVEFPDTLTTVGSYSFYGCRNIQQLQFSEGLTTIESHAFYNLDGITSLTLPKSVENIGDHAFSDCGNLKILDLGTGPITFGQYAFSSTNVVSPVIPEGVTVLPKYLFWNCRNIGGVYLPASIQNITGAFNNASLNRAYYAGDEDSWELVAGHDIDSSYSTVNVYFNGRTTADNYLAEGLTWNVSNNVLTISGSGAMPNYTSSSSHETVARPQQLSLVHFPIY